MSENDEVSSEPKIGAIVRVFNANRKDFLGYGIYNGKVSVDDIPDDHESPQSEPEPLDLSPEEEDALTELFGTIATTPKMTLHDGRAIFGYECWWDEVKLTEIENTDEARRAPPNQYRLLLAGHDDHRGLYHVDDFDRAEIAIQASNELHRSREIKGWGIVHDSKGFILTPPDDGGMQMMTYKKLLRRFGGGKRELSDQAFTTAHADAIEALQSERLPGWQKGDQMMVFWSDIVKATGAVALCGNF